MREATLVRELDPSLVPRLDTRSHSDNLTATSLLK